MKILAVVLLMVVLSLGANLAMALTDDATAVVTCTVATIVEWDNVVNAGNFLSIVIPDITDQATSRSNSRMLVLYTNGDLNITADDSNDAQLIERVTSNDTLVTEYKLEYDGDGATETGGTNVPWALYNAFIPSGSGSAVTHYTLDGAVEVTLFARASNDTGNVADAGAYTALQTLTATW